MAVNHAKEREAQTMQHSSGDLTFRSHHHWRTHFIGSNADVTRRGLPRALSTCSNVNPITISTPRGVSGKMISPRLSTLRAYCGIVHSPCAVPSMPAPPVHLRNSLSPPFETRFLVIVVTTYVFLKLLQSETSLDPASNSTNFRPPSSDGGAGAAPAVPDGCSHFSTHWKHCCEAPAITRQF